MKTKKNRKYLMYSKAHVTFINTHTIRFFSVSPQNVLDFNYYKN